MLQLVPVILHSVFPVAIFYSSLVYDVAAPNCSPFCVLYMTSVDIPWDPGSPYLGTLIRISSGFLLYRIYYAVVPQPSSEKYKENSSGKEQGPT